MPLGHLTWGSILASDSHRKSIERVIGQLRQAPGLCWCARYGTDSAIDPQGCAYPLTDQMAVVCRANLDSDNPDVRWSSSTARELLESHRDACADEGSCSAPAPEKPEQRAPPTRNLGVAPCLPMPVESVEYHPPQASWPRLFVIQHMHALEESLQHRSQAVAQSHCSRGQGKGIPAFVIMTLWCITFAARTAMFTEAQFSNWPLAFTPAKSQKSMWVLCREQWYLITVVCLLVVIIAFTAAALSGWESGWAKFSQDNYKSIFFPQRIRFEIWTGYVRGELWQSCLMHIFFSAGKDALAKAKTGTGKTVAFLVLLAFSPTDQFDCYNSFLNCCSDTTTELTHVTEF